MKTDPVLAVKEDFGKAMENGAGVEKPFNLGVLFVHGIGTQTRGQTLTAFGGPFCRWLQDRCEALEESRKQSGVAVEDINSGQQKLETVDWTDAFVPEAPPGAVSAECISHRVVLRETRFHDPADSAAPAHTKVAVLSLHSDNRVSKEDWLVAESWWAIRFLRRASRIWHSGALGCCPGSWGRTLRRKSSGAFESVLHLPRHRILKRRTRAHITGSGRTLDGFGAW